LQLLRVRSRASYDDDSLRCPNIADLTVVPFKLPARDDAARRARGAARRRRRVERLRDAGVAPAPRGHGEPRLRRRRRDGGQRGGHGRLLFVAERPARGHRLPAQGPALQRQALQAERQVGRLHLHRPGHPVRGQPPPEGQPPRQVPEARPRRGERTRGAPGDEPIAQVPDPALPRGLDVRRPGHPRAGRGPQRPRDARGPRRQGVVAARRLRAVGAAALPLRREPHRRRLARAPRPGRPEPGHEGEHPRLRLHAHVPLLRRRGGPASAAVSLFRRRA
jgi:hypothetical protein